MGSIRICYRCSVRLPTFHLLRFDSKSGWLSFTKSVDGAVYELEDNSYGMQRVEIRSVSSGIHLGHVFNDGPNGQPRYCINATVLEFKQRDNL